MHIETFAVGPLGCNGSILADLDAKRAIVIDPGVGRTDLWGGDSAVIARSIRERLYTLDPAAVVIAGHGDSTTIGEERAHNPFVAAR